MAENIKDLKVWQATKSLESQSIKNYNSLYSQIEIEFNNFYQYSPSSRFKNISAAELARFRKLLIKAKDLAFKLKDKEFSSKVGNLLKRTQIRREEMVLTTVEYNISEFTDNIIMEMDELLSNSIDASYESGMVLAKEEAPNEALVKDQSLTTVAKNLIMNQKYPGATYDQFIKDRKITFYRDVERIFFKNILADKSRTALLKDVKKLTKRQKQYTKLWLRNQVSFAVNLASKAAYSNAGADSYQFNAVLDGRTTEICRSLDGKIFKLKDGIPGVNMPPMYPPPHPCRSFITPIYGEK